MSPSYWDKKIEGYSQEDWVNKPSIFAEQAIEYFPQSGKLLEIGSGQGQDANYFFQNGYDVLATDISEKGLEIIKSKYPNISIDNLDASQKFPYQDSAFDVVYSHLSIHFFDNKVTQQLFDEIYRVLKPNGVIAVLVNSQKDSEYNTEEKLQDDLFNVNGLVKRFFSVESLDQFVNKFKKVVLDNKGETYKDENKNLIRFIGVKS